MHLKMQFITVFLIIGFSTFSMKEEVIYPSPSFSPKEVVSIQLQALAGINAKNTGGFLQTWIFAHPNNKAVTGPLERFSLMLQSPNYAILIGHKKHEIVDVFQKGEKAFLFVNILDVNGKLTALFRWELSLVRLKDNTAVWMTTNVVRLLKPDDVT